MSTPERLHQGQKRFCPENPRALRRRALALLGAATLALAACGAREATTGAPAPRSDGGALIDAEGVVRYTPPPGQAGVPLTLDPLDLERLQQPEFFRDNGYPGLNLPPPRADGGAGWLWEGGPVLRLSWPALALPPLAVCAEQGTLEQACSLAVMRLTLTPPSDHVRAQLDGRERLPDDDQVGQWMVFYSRGGRWDGWGCDAAQQARMNAALHAFGPLDGQWAQDPQAGGDCHVDGGWRDRLPVWLPQVLRGGAPAQAHPVLWRCHASWPADRARSQRRASADPARADALWNDSGCSASFLHEGRLAQLNVPGIAIAGPPERASLPQRLRPRLVQAAWATLERAAHGVPPVPVAALRQELLWCEQLDAASVRQRQAEPERAQDIARLWNDGPLAVTRSAYQPMLPCARALQRVLTLWLATPPGAAPAPDLLAAARKLAAIEQRQRGRVDQPLWALVDQMLARPGVASAAERLAWRLDAGAPSLPREDALRQYTAAEASLGSLPLAERLRLRLNVGLALYTVGESGHAHPRAPDLLWAAGSEWLAQPDALPEQEAATALLHISASQRMDSVDAAQARERLQALVPAMADLARRLARPSASDAGARYHRSAELAVHAAWHANWLALHGSDPARWRAWLSDWADWAPTVRPPVSEGEATITTTTTTAPRWVAGVLAHRAAAAAGRLTDPDCPGGPQLSCLFAVTEAR